MNVQWLFWGSDFLTVLILSLVLLFSIGVVWRIEKKLDLSYKFFVVALSCLTLGEVMALSAPETNFFLVSGKGIRLLGALFFLVSVLLMRDIVRELDHEKPPTQ